MPSAPHPTPQLSPQELDGLRLRFQQLSAQRCRHAGTVLGQQLAADLRLLQEQWAGVVVFGPPEARPGNEESPAEAELSA